MFPRGIQRKGEGLRIRFLTFVLLFFGVTEVFAQQSEIEARVSIMYRRNGQTAEFFENVKSGDEIHYPNRGMIPNYRVFSVYPTSKGVSARHISIESYKGKKLLTKVEPRPDNLGDRISFYDGYINDKENRVKVIIQLDVDGKPVEWSFVVLLDKV